MDANQIFFPVIAQIILVITLYVLLIKRKTKAANEGRVDKKRRSLHEDAWPDEVQQVNNCIRNQFEVPVLFYVLTFVLWASGGANILVIALSWLFFISRVMHAYIHVGNNIVAVRRKVFTLGVVIIIALSLIAIISVWGSVG